MCFPYEHCKRPPEWNSSLIDMPKISSCLIPRVMASCLALFSLLPAIARASDFPNPVTDAAVGQEKSSRKILFFSKCSDYEDPMVRRINSRPSVVETVLSDLGKENHVVFTFTKDGSVFTPENIAKYDAFCFFTSGDLLQPGGDQNPPMTPAGKAALLQAINDGKGFIGIHSATATFNSGPDGVDPYIQLLGGELQVRVRGLWRTQISRAWTRCRLISRLWRNGTR
jgi:hypothetical protein